MLRDGGRPDLDRIVSRTLAYGLLTVLLGLGYAAVVLGLGRLLGRNSSLAVAAAFQPLRRRVQGAVDRPGPRCGSGPPADPRRSVAVLVAAA